MHRIWDEHKIVSKNSLSRTNISNKTKLIHMWNADGPQSTKLFIVEWHCLQQLQFHKFVHNSTLKYNTINRL